MHDTIQDRARVMRTSALSRGARVAYVTTTIIAVLMAATSAIGLGFGASGLYGVDADLLPAFLGQDALNLIVGVPLLLGSMWLASRGSQTGLLTWIGALFYVMYDYGFYVLGAPFGPLFLAYAVVVPLSIYTMAGLVLSIDVEVVRQSYIGRIRERVIGGALVVVALVFIALWTMLTVAGLASGAGLDPIPRTVVTMDLTVQLPALLVGGILLWQRRPLGYVVAPGLLLQMAAYLLGLSAISILGRDATGAVPTPEAYLPGLIVGAIALLLLGFFVRAPSAESASSERRSVRRALL